MYTRPARRSDLPALAVLSAVAWTDDPVFELICPNRARYPHAFESMFLQGFRRSIVDLAVAFWVCVAAEDEDDAELCEMLRRRETEGKESLRVVSQTGRTDFILGYAIWTFHGMDAPVPTMVANKLFNSIESTLLNLEDIYTTRLLASPPLFNQPLRQAFNSLRRPFSTIYPHITPSLQLSNLGCAPWAQRRGVGTRLMAWGLNVARQNEMVCELTASVLGQGLYAKSGFLVVDWPGMAVGEGGARMVFDPTLGEGDRREGRWIVREGDLEVERWGRKRRVEARMKRREEMGRSGEQAEG